MLAPTAKPFLEALLTGGILVTSLLGSGHCAAMCGGLVLNFAKSGRAMAVYHLGRLFSYSLLGALAGALGGLALSISNTASVQWTSSLVFAGLLILVGVRRIQGKPLHINMPKFVGPRFQHVFGRALQRSDSMGSVFAVGFLSALLPCGWLYTFVLAATTTKSAWLGAASLALFWLGTVPALSVTHFLFEKIFRKLKWSSPRYSGAMLVLLGVFSLGLHAAPLLSPQSDPTECPMHSGSGEDSSSDQESVK